MAFTACLAAFFAFCPGVQSILASANVGWYIFIMVPFAVLTLMVDELRKLCIRASPGGIIERLTYY